MKYYTTVFASLYFLAFASAAKSEPIELIKKPRLTPDVYLGIYNSAMGAGLGLSSDVSERLTIGIRWFGGSENVTDAYNKDYKSTRIHFENSGMDSDEFSAFGRYRILDTLSVTASIDQKKSAGRLDISDKENFFRRGQVNFESTVYSFYTGIGNYWTGSWYKIGADWLGISLPFSAKADSSYSYFEPTGSGFSFEEENPSKFYRGVNSLLNDAKSQANDVGATLLLGNLSFIF